MRKIKTVPCKWCGKETAYLSTQMCDAHWELSRRIESEPEMARIMLEIFDPKPQ